MHGFQIWEEASAPKENPHRHRKNMQTQTLTAGAWNTVSRTCSPVGHRAATILVVLRKWNLASCVTFVLANTMRQNFFKQYVTEAHLKWMKWSKKGSRSMKGNGSLWFIPCWSDAEKKGFLSIKLQYLLPATVLGHKSTSTSRGVSECYLIFKLLQISFSNNSSLIRQQADVCVLYCNCIVHNTTTSAL